MGFLDRMGGTPQDRLAREVLAVSRRLGFADGRYDPADFSVGFRWGPDGTPGDVVYLDILFRECRNAGRAERRDMISRLLASMAAAASQPDTWDEVRELLRPVLRAGVFCHGAGPEAATPLFRPAFPLLAEMVVIDLPLSMAYVRGPQREGWGAPAARVFDTARANLARLVACSGDPAGEADSRHGRMLLRFVDDGDTYVVSRLLLDGWLGGLADRIGGRPVAFVPDHNVLLVTDDQPDHLRGVFELVEKEYLEAVRPLSPQAYTLDAFGAVVPYPAPESHPLAVAVHRADTVLASIEYGTQRQDLSRAYERDGVDVFVADLRVFRRADGSVYSYALWSEDVDTLLPRAQYIGLQSGAEHFCVRWETLEREVDLVPVEGLTPQRYRVRWPHPGVVARLRAACGEP